MDNWNDHSNDSLDDADLLARESEQRSDFRRLEQAEPRFRYTTYGIIRASPALIASWERWWKTNLAARMRGIITRTLGR